MSIWAKPLTDKGITGLPQIWPKFFTALELQKTNHPNKNTRFKKVTNVTTPWSSSVSYKKILSCKLKKSALSPLCNIRFKKALSHYSICYIKYISNTVYSDSN